MTIYSIGFLSIMQNLKGGDAIIFIYVEAFDLCHCTITWVQSGYLSVVIVVMIVHLPW